MTEPEDIDEDLFADLSVASSTDSFAILFLTSQSYEADDSVDKAIPNIPVTPENRDPQNESAPVVKPSVTAQPPHVIEGLDSSLEQQDHGPVAVDQVPIAIRGPPSVDDSLEVPTGDPLSGTDTNGIGIKEDG